jgi:tRNA nucleotidyltransferase/poly(A) polymerase
MSGAGAFSRLLEILDRMEVPYLVGGSVASSAHGMPRTTLDVDLVVDLRPEQIEEFAENLKGEFYADAETIRECFARGRAANLIHMGSAWKFDLFPLQGDDYSRVSFGRRKFRDVRPDGREAVECAVATPEDTILRKLEWYRAGGESSERQWNDIRGVYAAAGSRLDIEYLRLWAGELKIADLLETLMAE